MEPGEDPPTAPERDLREESGCSVVIDTLVGVYSDVGTPEQVVFCFLCSHTEGEPHARGGCGDAGRSEPEEALRLVRGLVRSVPNSSA